MELTESQIERKVCKWAKEKGILSYKFVSPQNSGVPDRMFIGPSGHVVFIEFKKPGGKLSALQIRTLDTMMRHRATVGVYDNFDGATEFLKVELI
jgi:hypothetical protein